MSCAAPNDTCACSLHPSQGTVTDALGAFDTVQYVAFSIFDSSRFEAAARAAKQRMINTAKSEMACIVAFSFALHRFAVGAENSPLKVIPELSVLTLGPFSAVTMGLVELGGPPVAGLRLEFDEAALARGSVVGIEVCTFAWPGAGDVISGMVVHHELGSTPTLMGVTDPNATYDFPFPDSRPVKCTYASPPPDRHMIGAVLDFGDESTEWALGHLQFAFSHVPFISDTTGSEVIGSPAQSVKLADGTDSRRVHVSNVTKALTSNAYILSAVEMALTESDSSAHAFAHRGIGGLTLGFSVDPAWVSLKSWQETLRVLGGPDT